MGVNISERGMVNVDVRERSSCHTHTTHHTHATHTPHMIRRHTTSGSYFDSIRFTREQVDLMQYILLVMYYSERWHITKYEAKRI